MEHILLNGEPPIELAENSVTSKVIAQMNEVTPAIKQVR